MRRRRLALSGLLLVLAVALLYLAAPRLLDRYAPAWTVTADLPVATSADTLREATDCLDVLASEQVVADAETGRLTATFHALGWEARRVTSCLRQVPMVANAKVTRANR